MFEHVLPWDRQPEAATRPSDEARKLLQNLWVASPAGLIDGARGDHARKFNSFVSPTVGAFGRTVEGSGQGNVSVITGCATAAGGVPLTGATEATVFTLLEFTSVSASGNDYPLVRKDQDGNAGSNFQFALSYMISAGPVLKLSPLLLTTGTTGWVGGTGVNMTVVPKLGVLYLAGFRWKSGTWELFFQPVGASRVPTQASPVSPTGAVTASNEALCQTHFLGTAYTTGYAAPVRLYGAGFARRFLSDSFLGRIRARPWSTYTPRRILLPSAAVATAATPVVSAGVVALAGSSASGTQGYLSTVAAASVAAAGSGVAGSQVFVGAVAAAAVTTVGSAPAGTETVNGAVAPGAVAAAGSATAGSQVYNAIAAAAAVAVGASAPAGTQVFQGAVAAAAVSLLGSTPTADGSVNGSVAAGALAVVATSPAGAQTYNSTVVTGTVAAAASSPAGTQVYQGTVAAGSVATLGSSPAADGSVNGSVAPSAVAAVASSPAGAQTYQGAVAAAAAAVLGSTPVGTQAQQGAVAPAAVQLLGSAPAADGAVNGAVAPGATPVLGSPLAGTQIYVGSVAPGAVAVGGGDARPPGGTRLLASERRAVVYPTLRRQVLYPSLRRVVQCYPE